MENIRGLRLFDSQLQFQQDMLRMVPRGYFFHTSGVSKSRDKLMTLAGKFEENYGTALDRSERQYRRKKELANTLFSAIKMPDGTYIWYLLATDGLGPIRNEPLKDARSTTGTDRIMWGDSYMMAVATKPRDAGGGTYWSWWLQPRKLGILEQHSIYLIKEDPAEIPSFWTSQKRRPMHAGIRSQLTRLLKSNIKLWSACHPGREWPGPKPPLSAITGYR